MYNVTKTKETLKTQSEGPKKICIGSGVEQHVLACGVGPVSDWQAVLFYLIIISIFTGFGYILLKWGSGDE